MRILYCIGTKYCIYVSLIEEIWIECEDIYQREAKICFIDSLGTTYISEKMKYNLAASCMNIITKEGYLNLENHIFEAEEEE